MKKLTLSFSVIMTIMLAFVWSSCKNDETTPDAPVATPPSAVTTAVAGSSSEVSFTVAIPGKYASSTVTATGGTATLKSEPAVDATEGTVVVTFVAGTTTGAGSISLTITDANAKSSTAQAVLNVTAAAVYTEVSTTITANTTWTADKKYLLKGNIYVQSPAELTIEAGTKIFGDKVTKGALIVSRGAKIHAVGTADKPIIFTSSAPKGFRNYGDWGGVVLLGKAQNNQSVNQAIEGISAPTGDNGLYGGDGSTNADNTGELQYARIEFAGIALSTDNELNGLTLGGVGSGTKVDHIQVSYSGDDSYEWFGGTVNSTYLIAYRGWDDEFDTDFGYSGKNQFLVSFRDPNIADKSGSNGFESDNNAQGDAKTPQTSATFANVTFFGPYMYANLSSAGALSASNVSANYARGAHIRRNSALKVYNTIFAGANLRGIDFDATSSSAVFKGNYVARMLGAAKIISSNTTPITTYDASAFFTDNTINGYIAGTSTDAFIPNAVDLNAVFAGSSIKSPSTAATSQLWDIAAPKALLATGSPLLTGAIDLTAQGFVKTDYIGAFDASNNWASAAWINYDPNNTDYGN